MSYCSMLMVSFSGQVVVVVCCILLHQLDMRSIPINSHFLGLRHAVSFTLPQGPMLAFQECLCFIWMGQTQFLVTYYYCYFICLKTWSHFIVLECEEGDVRLVDSNMKTNASGRVELCLSNEWRIVGDETWGVEEATVVCRQLGLPTDG